MSTHADVIVVGAGPIGSAAARHLATLGERVVVVGPDEPADFVGHRGLWSGHYDQGRLAAIDVPFVASVVGLRAMRRFPGIEAESGVRFTEPHPLLTVSPEDEAGTLPDGDGHSEFFGRDSLIANIDELGGSYELLDGATLASRYPDLHVPPGHVAVHQRDAMIVNPRQLVRAELALAERHGATRLRAEVVGIEEHAGGVEVVTRTGDRLGAGRVLLATGASTNACGLLPEPIASPTYGCTIVLVEVDPAVDFPTLMVYAAYDGNVYGGIFVPPRAYPDGKVYLKGTGAALLDNPLGSYAEIERWVGTGGSEAERDHCLRTLRDLMPGLGIGAVWTRPCLVSMNESCHPYIGFVSDRVALATEGERGVMMADEIGRLAAGLVTAGRWSDTLPEELFRVRFAARRPADLLSP